MMQLLYLCHRVTSTGKNVTRIKWSPLNTLFVQTAVSFRPVSVMFYILILTTKTNTAVGHFRI